MKNTPLAGDRIVRSEEPPNLEMPFEKLDGFVTRTESFYIRTHFPVPKIEKKSWQLSIEGLVGKPFAIRYDDLIKLPSRTIPATLECAGNNRNLLEEKVKGVQWGLGAVGNAEWTGVELSVLLDRAGVKGGACEVILEGADRGTVDDGKAPAGELKFARSIPIQKARGDVILAWQMNGAELLPEHGFPVRAIVPGWYAVASVKWLERVSVTDQPFNGYYQTLDYAFWRRRGELAELVPLTELQTKAQISRPVEGDTVDANATVRVRGAAWTGGAEIVKVELSTDGGKTWGEAELLGESAPNAWRLWQFDWQTPAQPGKQTLVARAIDSRGQSQPTSRDPDRGTYMINHLLPVTVNVR